MDLLEIPCSSNSSTETDIEGNQPQDIINQFILPAKALNLIEVQEAYHVTNVPAFCPKPAFTHLLVNLPLDGAYDGILLGLPCLFLSTTKWGPILPTISPYPSNGVPGQFHWRAKVPLACFDVYDEFWLIGNLPPSQVKVLLTKGDEERNLVENIPGIQRIDKNNNPYLCKVGDKWFSNDYQNEDTKFFVNILILHDFLLPCSTLCQADCDHWDTVRRNQSGKGAPLSREQILSYYQKQWSIAQKTGKMREALFSCYRKSF